MKERATHVPMAKIPAGAVVCVFGLGIEEDEPEYHSGVILTSLL